ncbi:hypothetical protein WR25_18018 [Diploscapter pachys]|uniref:NAD-specific glutamate dehydrogenase n=1 Tax=Diploscapter pachys TaxID=2018661 RepID=A0A2A2M3Y9_9BILA|nr:hypothetical protein WR25_18018 [Diploscapter pachys]
MLLLDLTLDQATQLLEALEAEVLGQILVDLALAGDLDLLDGDVERRGLAGEFLGAIVFREGDVERLFLAQLHADELVLEARDQATRAELDAHVGAGAAVERNAVAGLAYEVDGDEVTHLSGLVLGRIVPLLRLVGELLQLLVHRFIGDGHGQTLQLQRVDGRRRHGGQHFHLDGDDRVLARRIIVVQRDRGLHRGAQLLVGDQRLHAFLDRAVERVGGQRLAVHLAHQVHGHLAGTEAGHLHLRRDALHFGIDLGIDVLRRDGQRVGALQALVQRLDSLHIRPSILRNLTKNL